MKNGERILCMISILLMAMAVAQAQIPNAGFETWSGGVPTGWITTNAGPIAPITQTSDAHSGSYALQGTTLAYLTINYPAEAYANFSVNARYGSFKGWYKYSPVGGDSLYIHAIFFKGTTGVAFAQFTTAASVTSYTQFSVPMTYVSSLVPDTAYVEILQIPYGSSYHAGTTFKIDDLSFGAATGVEGSSSSAPREFALSQNYPNPFNPATTISFTVPMQSQVSLKVYDCLGKEVGTLVSEELSAGTHTRVWNASHMPSGVYYCRLQSGVQTETKKLILVK